MDSDNPKSEQVEEAAVRWFMRQQSDAWTDADQALLDEWLDTDVAHRVQYLRVECVWMQSGRMRALGAGVSPGDIPSRMAWGDQRFLRRSSSAAHAPERDILVRQDDERSTGAKVKSKRRFLAVAASLAFLAGATYVLHAGLLAGSRYSTPVGGIKNVSLEDGSKITLNTDTRLRVVLGEHERRIRLDKGEAFFEVAKDQMRPFVVQVGDKRVVAVGTKFAVRRNDDDVQVVVTEGRVRLATAPMSQADGGEQFAGRVADSIAGRERAQRTSKRTSKPKMALLDAGAIAQTLNAEVLVRPEAEAEAEKLLSWRFGYVFFDNVTLAQAVAEFNRYNDTKIVIDDPAIGAFLIGGNFRSNSTGAFLDLLQSGFPITVEQRADQVILKPR